MILSELPKLYAKGEWMSGEQSTQPKNEQTNKTALDWG